MPTILNPLTVAAIFTAVSATAACANEGADAAQPEPTAHWPLDAPESSRAFVQGRASTLAGVDGRSVALDGETLITLRDSADLTENADGFAFTVWVNPHELGRDQQMIAAKNRYALDQRQWGVMIDRDDRIRLYVWQGGWRTVEDQSVITPGRWRHVGVSIDGKQAALYVDGRAVGKIELDGPIAGTDAPITLGGVDDDGRLRQTLRGALDDARVFDRPLTADQFVALYTPVESVHDLPKPPAYTTLWDPQTKMPRAADLPSVADATFHVIKANEPEVDGYRWLHGVALCFHGDQLYASFGLNRGAENTGSEEAWYRVSDDLGKTWGPMKTIDVGEESDDHAVSHGVFLSHGGKLWAFMGSFNGKLQDVHTRAYVLDESSGEWRAKGRVVGGGFWPMQEPIRMADGNWIMSGLICGKRNPPAVAISRGDDLTRWELITLPDDELGNVWGESVVVVDGATITNICRYGKRAQALTAQSDDYGRTWTALTPSNMPMVTSQPYAGVLSTGQRYLVATNTADSGQRRSPLTIAVSRPDERLFSRVYQIRDAVHDGPGESHPASRLSYPYAVERDGKLYVGYSNSASRGGNHNSAELAVFPVDALQAD